MPAIEQPALRQSVERERTGGACLRACRYKCSRRRYRTRIAARRSGRCCRPACALARARLAGVRDGRAMSANKSGKAAPTSDDELALAVMEDARRRNEAVAGASTAVRTLARHGLRQPYARCLSRARRAGVYGAHGASRPAEQVVSCQHRNGRCSRCVVSQAAIAHAGLADKPVHRAQPTGASRRSARLWQALRRRSDGVRAPWKQSRASPQRDAPERARSETCLKRAQRRETRRAETRSRLRKSFRLQQRVKLSGQPVTSWPAARWTEAAAWPSPRSRACACR